MRGLLKILKRYLREIHPGWLLLGFALFLLWDFALLLPLKVFVVFLHELSHAVAAVVSGGEVIKITIDSNQGGLCTTAGGSRFLTLSAGYLGSLLWGGAIIFFSCQSRLDKAMSIGLGAMVVLVTLFFIDNLFGLLFGIAFGAAMGAIGWYASEQVNDRILRAIGFTSCIYAVLDVKSDILDRPGISSDARMLAELTGIPTLVWGLLWFAVAVVLTIYFLAVSSRSLKKKAAANRSLLY